MALINNGPNNLGNYANESRSIQASLRRVDNFIRREIQPTEFHCTRVEKVILAICALCAISLLTLAIYSFVCAKTASFYYTRPVSVGKDLYVGEYVRMSPGQVRTVGIVCFILSTCFASGLCLQCLFLQERKWKIEQQDALHKQCQQLCRAIRERDLQRVQELAIDKIVNRHYEVDRGTNITCIRYAAAYGGVDIVQHLVEKVWRFRDIPGMEGKPIIGGGMGCLDFAVLGGDINTVNYLAKTLPPADNYPPSSLWFASLYGQKEMVESLLTHGADVMICFPPIGWGFNSCFIQDDEILKTLLASSFDPLKVAASYHLDPSVGINPDAAQSHAIEVAGPALNLQSRLLKQEMSRAFRGIQAETFTIFNSALKVEDLLLVGEEKKFLFIYRQLPCEIQMQIVKHKARAIIEELIKISARPNKNKWVWRGAREGALLPYIPLFKEDIQREIKLFIRQESNM